MDEAKERFIIVTGQDRSDFIHRVNERLSSGYQLVGGPFITTFAKGLGNIRSFPPTFEDNFGDLFIYTEFNQAMTYTPSNAAY